MKKVLIVFFFLGALAATAVTIQLTGIWQLTFSALLPGEETPCVYQGTITVNEAMVGGSSTVNLQSGPDACPDQLVASISSLNVDGSSIFGTLDGGQQFGTVQFEGNVFQGAQVQLRQKGVQQPMENSAEGSFVIDSGPFSDTEGSWSAQFQGPLSQIPLLSPIGLLALASMLVLAAFYLHRRQRVLTR